MVTLQRVTSGNPFERYPALRSVFAGDRARYVEEDTVGDLAKGQADLYRNHIYLIADAAGEVVGITGFFQLGVGSGPHDTLALRWHGVTPNKRGLGLSHQAFRAVCDEVEQVYSRAERLLEFVPMADAANAEALLAYFGGLGFERDGGPRDASTFPGAAALPPGSGNWQAMSFRLRHPAKTQWIGKFAY